MQLKLEYGSFLKFITEAVSSSDRIYGAFQMIDCNSPSNFKITYLTEILVGKLALETHASPKKISTNQKLIQEIWSTPQNTEQ